jgi:SagB-type dehydrogenase family enzyme
VQQELFERIAALTDEEREILLRQVRNASGKRRPFDDVSLFHDSLVAEVMDVDVANLDDSLLTMKPPDVRKTYPDRPQTPLPTDLIDIGFPLDEVIAARASRRDFIDQPIDLSTLATLLHYSYGVRKYVRAYNDPEFPSRFVPSSGGLQAVELYLVTNAVDALPQGLYHFNATANTLELLDQGNMRRTITSAALQVDWLAHAAVVVALTCVMDRVKWKYGPRGYRFIHVDAGCVANSLYLVATALRLRACAIAAFMDGHVNEFLGVDGREEFTTLLLGIGSRPPDAGRS